MGTFCGRLQFSAVSDLDRLLGLVSGSFGYVLDLLDNVIALEDLAEDDVTPIEPARNGGGNEELGALRESAIIAAVVVVQDSPFVSLPEFA